MEKFRNKYRIPSARLKGYDYGANGRYFVTICTKNRVAYFGDIVSPVATDNNALPVETNNNAVPVETNNNPLPVETNNNALPVETNNNALPVQTDNYPSLRATEIGKMAAKFWMEIPHHFPFVTLDAFVVMPNHIHGILCFYKPNKTDWIPNQFGPQSQNLGSVIRGFKASLKRYANKNQIAFEWQPRYHDSIIRTERSLHAIRRYILNNPKNWDKDRLRSNQKIPKEKENFLSQQIALDLEIDAYLMADEAGEDQE